MSPSKYPVGPESEDQDSLTESLKRDIFDSIRLYFSPFFALVNELSSTRISEKAIVIPALRAAAKRPNGFISTRDLILELEAELRPHGEDAEILEGRADTRFSQIVRNLKSHKESSTNIFRRGLAIEKGDGLQITSKGLTFLRQLPDNASRGNPA